LLQDVVDVRKVVYLMIDDHDALVKRLSLRAKKSNRPDDADPAVIRKRIEVYEQETFPVLEAYSRRLVARVNADQHPLAVLRDVADCLTDVVSPNI
jgi:adenylate kinase